MENINNGIPIMVIGMLVVFMFLGLMIVVMNVTAKVINFINKYYPEEITKEQNSIKKNQDVNAEIALAIACAVHRGGLKQ